MPVKGFRTERYRIVCPCGKEMFVTISLKDTKKFCSKACFAIFFVSPQKGVLSSKLYCSLHHWVSKNKTKPTACEFCNKTEVDLQWANKSHEYRVDLDDWLALCIPCHRKHDLDENGMKRGDAIKRFPELLKKPTYCGSRKFTKEQVVDMYTSTLYQKELCDKYKIDAGYLCAIRSGRLYKRYTKDLKRGEVKPMYIKMGQKEADEVRRSNLKGFQLAEKYGVSQATISDIRNGKRWT